MTFDVASSNSNSYLVACQNGPVHVPSGTTPVPNPNSWDTLADTIWIDQPVGKSCFHSRYHLCITECTNKLGTGWSTTDTNGYRESHSTPDAR